jgi:hypothetical protein
MYLKQIFLAKKDGEKWSRKKHFELPPCAKPFFLENLFYCIERGFLHKISSSVIKIP